MAVAGNMTGNGTSSCPKMPGTSSSGIFAGDNPLKTTTVSLLIFQICVILLVSRTLALILKPMRQPRVIAEIVAGILIGPSALGRWDWWLPNVFPAYSMTILNTVANIGLIFFLFLVGIELDTTALRKIGKNAVAVSMAGIALPFGTGVLASYAIREILNFRESDFLSFVVFMGVAMSITAFPVLARILAERKLLPTDIGQLTMSAAAVDDAVAWCLLALSVALINSKHSPIIALYSLLCLIGFLAFMLLVTMPFMARVSNYAKAFDQVPESIILGCFLGALIFAFFTDLVGVHAIFGGFVFGLVIPKDGPLGHALTAKLEDFIVMILIPLFFASSGIKTQISLIDSGKAVLALLIVVTVAVFGKLLGCGLVAHWVGHSIRKSLTVGFLMSTKGLVELIVLNIGLQQKVINEQIFTIMVLMALITTFMTSPIVGYLYVPARDDPADEKKMDEKEKAKKTEGSKEITMLACVNTFRTVPMVLNLVEATSGGSGSLKVDSLHLVELSDRPSAFMKFSGPAARMTYAVDPVEMMFEGYGRMGRVNIRHLVAISSLEDMHEDILLTATRRRSNLIVMPYFEGAGLSVFFEAGGNFNPVTMRVLQQAKSSVAVLVDRNTSGDTGSLTDGRQTSMFNVLVLFFGGPDDREALALATRMASHPMVSVTVLHLTGHGEGGEGGQPLTVALGSVDVEGALKVEEAAKDAAAVAAFSKLTSGKDGKKEPAAQAIKLEEVQTTPRNVVDAAVAAAGEEGAFDLVIVGRGEQRKPALLASADLTITTEAGAVLGAVGEAIYSNTAVDAAAPAGPELSSKKPSILVVQQFDPLAVRGQKGLRKSGSFSHLFPGAPGYKAQGASESPSPVPMNLEAAGNDP